MALGLVLELALGLQLGLRLKLGLRFIFQLCLLRFCQACCCRHLGGKIDTAINLSYAYNKLLEECSQ